MIHRVDNNQKQIDKLLTAIGAEYVDLTQVGSGCPDRLVAWRGRLFLLECKNPDTHYGRHGLSASQKKFHDRMAKVGIQVLVAWTQDDALELIQREEIKIR